MFSSTFLEKKKKKKKIFLFTESLKQATEAKKVYEASREGIDDIEGNELPEGQDQEGNGDDDLVKANRRKLQPQSGQSEKIAVLMISCNRPDISRALDKIIQ